MNETQNLLERIEAMTYLGWNAIRDDVIATIKTQESKIQELESKAS